MIPFIEVDVLELGPLSLQPFGLLVVLGIYIGTRLAERRADSLKMDPDALRGFIACILIFGFVGAHVYDQILYHPEELLERPWAVFVIWGGISSFGGFLGALSGALFFKYFELAQGSGKGLEYYGKLRRRAAPAAILPWCDVIVSVFPISWIFGRMGCAAVHDHLGAVAHTLPWLAVSSGHGQVWDFGIIHFRFGNLPRYDLGLLEVFFAMALSAAFVLSWRRQTPVGFYCAAACLAYAPVRFALDFLRLDETDARYLSLTPAQWTCIGMFALGAALLVRVVRAAPRATTVVA